MPQPRTRPFLRDYTRDLNPGWADGRQTTRRTRRLPTVVGGGGGTIRSRAGRAGGADVSQPRRAARRLGVGGVPGSDPGAQEAGKGERAPRPQHIPAPRPPAGGKVQRGPVNNGAGRARGHGAPTRRPFRRTRPLPGTGAAAAPRGPRLMPPAQKAAAPVSLTTSPGPARGPPLTGRRPRPRARRRRAYPAGEGRPGQASHSPEPRRDAARLTAASEPGGPRG